MISSIASTVSQQAENQISRKRILLRAVGLPLLFLFMSACFLWQPILTGKVPLPVDVIYQYDYVWRQHIPDGLDGFAQNPILSDVAFQFYPYRKYTIESLAAGQFPLWNPYILTGLPFFAGAQAAVLDPVNLLTYPLGALDVWTLDALLRLTLIGLGTYGFARAIGRSTLGAIGAGVVFTICGFVTVWLNYNVVYSLTWMPALFWATAHLLSSRCPAWIAATAFALGALALGGHPETQFLASLIWSFYCLYSLLFTVENKKRLGLFGRLLAAAALGLAFGAVQWLPFFVFLLNSNAPAARAVTIANPDAGDILLRLALIFFPNVAGSPANRTYWYPLLNFNEQTGYIGLLATGLAVLGALYWFKRDRQATFFAIMGAFAILFAIRAPGFHLLQALPPFSFGQGIRWWLVWSFCGALLAGFGLDALLSLAQNKTTLRNLTLAFAAGAVILLGALWAIYLGIRFGEWDLAWHTTLDHISMAGLFYPTNLQTYWPVVFLALGAVLLFICWRGPLRASGLRIMVTGLLFAELWVFGSRYNTVMPASGVYPAAPTTDYLTQNLGHDRFAAVSGIIWPNSGMVFHLRDLHGYEVLIDGAFAQLYKPLIAPLTLANPDALNLTGAEQRLLSMAGVRYILTTRKIRVDGSASAYRWSSDDGQVAIYENLEALPRAYVVFNAQVAPDLATATRQLLDPTTDLHNTVILTGAATPMQETRLGAGSVPVKWLRDEPEEVTVAADMPAPGYLILNDNYADGWVAEVDGQPVPILHANAVFRSVILQAGPHRVTFVYRPQPVLIGIVVSVVGVVIMIALLSIALRSSSLSGFVAKLILHTSNRKM